MRSTILLALLPTLALAQAKVRPGFVEMEVRHVVLVQGSVAVILQPRSDRDLALPIFIGETEANAIRQRIDRTTPIRPLTHDLLETMISSLGGKVTKIEVDSLRDNIYLGTAYVQQGEKTVTIDARPSDLIALALGTGAPIYAAKKVLDQAGVRDDGATQAGPPTRKRRPPRHVPPAADQGI